MKKKKKKKPVYFAGKIIVFKVLYYPYRLPKKRSRSLLLDVHHIGLQLGIISVNLQAFDMKSFPTDLVVYDDDD